jgi:hypothetical protein
VELVDIERKQLEFSYKDRNGYHFMDPETTTRSRWQKILSVKPRITLLKIFRCRFSTRKAKLSRWNCQRP